MEMLEERKRMKSLLLLSAEVLIRDLKNRDLGYLSPGIIEYLNQVGAKHGVSYKIFYRLVQKRQIQRDTAFTAKFG